ncbi:MAG: penicillin-insensitive murein endopeptidase [Pseudomonadota bacterium]
MHGILRLTLTSLLVSFPMLTASHAVELPLPEAKPSGHKRITTQLMFALVPARDLFKQARAATPAQPQAIGRYARGCLAGGVEIPTDGRTWQAMRLSRQRRWGHPDMIELVKRLSRDAAKYDGWPGLLVGDISMARGGPMWPSHASHQIGLDADIWLTPMPDRRLTRRERETLSATYMLTKNQLSINPNVWTRAHERLLKRVASYSEVERVLVHPAIKRQLCKTAGRDRAWLSKMRPVWGHNYHFHIRMKCPADNRNCRPQQPPPTVDGCGAELARWYKRLHARLKPLNCAAPENQNKRACFCRVAANKGHARCKRRKRRLLTLADLPNQCTRVLTTR